MRDATTSLDEINSLFALNYLTIRPPKHVRLVSWEIPQHYFYNKCKSKYIMISI